MRLLCLKSWLLQESPNGIYIALRTIKRKSIRLTRFDSNELVGLSQKWRMSRRAPQMWSDEFEIEFEDGSYSSFKFDDPLRELTFMKYFYDRKKECWQTPVTMPKEAVVDTIKVIDHKIVPLWSTCIASLPEFRESWNRYVEARKDYGCKYDENPEVQQLRFT